MRDSFIAACAQILLHSGPCHKPRYAVFLQDAIQISFALVAHGLGLVDNKLHGRKTPAQCFEERLRISILRRSCRYYWRPICQHTDLCVSSGIKTPEDAKEMATIADGVVDLIAKKAD